MINFVLAAQIVLRSQSGVTTQGGGTYHSFVAYPTGPLMFTTCEIRCCSIVYLKRPCNNGESIRMGYNRGQSQKFLIKMTEKI